MVIQQQHWDEKELRENGFRQFSRKKEIVMARELPASEAPKTIKTSWGEDLIAEVGYIICYAPEETVHQSLDNYKHWPVEPTIFQKTYEAWDEPFEPTPAQQSLLNKGCTPYYKAVKVWAKELEDDVYIQSLEHEQPVLVGKERVLAIGVEGEPYHMGDDTFHDRYDGNLHGHKNGFKAIVNKLLGFFKGD